MTGGAEEFGQRGNGKWDCPVERNLALQNSHCSNGLAGVATQGATKRRVSKRNGLRSFGKLRRNPSCSRTFASAPDIRSTRCNRGKRKNHSRGARDGLACEEKRKCGARNRSREISHRRQSREVVLGKNALVVQRVAKDDERLGQHGNGFLAGGAAAHPGGIVERTD